MPTNQNPTPSTHKPTQPPAHPTHQPPNPPTTRPTNRIHHTQAPQPSHQPTNQPPTIPTTNHLNPATGPTKPTHRPTMHLQDLPRKQAFAMESLWATSSQQPSPAASIQHPAANHRQRTGACPCGQCLRRLWAAMESLRASSQQRAASSYHPSHPNHSHHSTHQTQATTSHPNPATSITSQPSHHQPLASPAHPNLLQASPTNPTSH